MGFYLQSTISHMVLPKEFWSRLVEIPNVRAIKIAPFNRYQTLDVLEAVAQSGRRDEIALYTGNDDNIIVDLLTPQVFHTEAGEMIAADCRGAAGPVGVLDQKGGGGSGEPSRRFARQGRLSRTRCSRWPPS